MPDNLLTVDLGGTRIRFAQFTSSNCLIEGSLVKFLNSDFSSISDAFQRYIETMKSLSLSFSCSNCVLAVAAPIEGDEVRLTNFSWSFSCKKLQDEFGFHQLQVVNDFAVLGQVLPYLEESHLHLIGNTDAKRDINLPMVVLGSGTGVGVASCIKNKSGWSVISTEGGHLEFAPQDEEDIEIFLAAKKRMATVSYENLLCGKGVELLDSLIAEINGRGKSTRTAAEIQAQAKNSEQAALATIARFWKLCGNFAGQVALVAGARGGVFITGGVADQLLEWVNDSDFRLAFENKGVMSSYNRSIQSAVITHPYPALAGCAALFMNKN